jgi:activating signal cointegrator complex subunit 3
MICSLCQLNLNNLQFLWLQIKEEQWWLVLGNTSTSELYALKRVSFSDHLVTTMKLPPTAANLQVKMTCHYLNLVPLQL